MAAAHEPKLHLLDLDSLNGPLYQTHPLFTSADRDDRIWRYMNLAKFLRMVQTSSVRFTLAEALGDDKWEGVTPRYWAIEVREGWAHGVPVCAATTPDQLLAHQRGRVIRAVENLRERRRRRGPVDVWKVYR